MVYEYSTRINPGGGVMPVLVLRVRFSVLFCFGQKVFNGNEWQGERRVGVDCKFEDDGSGKGVCTFG
jgi:hypothetical protein